MKHRGRRVGVSAVPMSTFGWCELHHITEAVRISTQADCLDASGVITAIKNETVDRKNKSKKRFKFMMLMTSSGSAESGASQDRPAPAIVMKESYYNPRRGIFPVPEDHVLQSSPFVLMRADHGAWTPISERGEECAAPRLPRPVGRRCRALPCYEI